MNELKYILSVFVVHLKRSVLSAVEAIWNVPGVSITDPNKKNHWRVVKLAVIQNQTDESFFFSIYELSYLKRIMRL